MTETAVASFETTAAAVKPRAIVAIPVRDERDRIAACLRALDAQEDVPRGGFGIILFLNNCVDDTETVVVETRASMAWPVRVVTQTFEAANAGWARRAAMEAAASWLREVGAEDGVILTTDADSRVDPCWLARNLRGIANGADAVAGRLALDPDDAAALPATLHARGRLESTYEALLTEIEARLVPEPGNPWPCHWTASGASLCVRLAAYARAGGMPALPLGEDRAFVAALRASGARVRHDPQIVVTTSGRVEGRARGGAADTIKLRCDIPDSPCDPRLEPVARMLWRLTLTRRGPARDLSLPRRAPFLDRALNGARVDQLDLDRPATPLRPSELPVQIRLARLVVVVLRLRDWTRRRTYTLASRLLAGNLDAMTRPRRNA